MTVSDAGSGRGQGTTPGGGKPADGGAKPDAGDAKPDAGEAKPAAGDVEAAAGESKPADAETKPVPGETKPVPGETKPVPGETKPVPGETKPAASESKPAAGDAKSAPGDAKPGPGDAKPAPGDAKQPAAAAAAAAGAGAGALSGDERAELEHLRDEVAQIHGGEDHPAAPARRKHNGWRAPVSVVLIVIGCILAPLSVVAVWTANQVSNTDRYVANLEPLVHDPAVQRALTDKITIEIESRLNVKGLTTQAATALSQKGLTRVGALLNSFSGQIAGAVNGFIHTQVAKIVASPQFARLWVEVNRRAHAQLVKALSGQGNGSITISNGKVVLNTGPLINLIKSRLAGRGLTIVNKIPYVNPTFPLFDAKYLVKAQSGYRLLNDLKIVLPILTLVLLGLGVYVARRHRRALIGAGLGFAASMAILGLGLTIFRGIYLGSVPSSVLPADAAAVLYDTLVRFIRDGLRILLVVGLIVAIGAFFSGPSVTAVRTRGAFKHGFDWIRGRGERAGVSTGPVGRWTYTHRRALRITAVAIAALVFVFWGLSSWVTVVVIAIVLLVVLGLIELIGRPPARPEVAAQPGG
jgi:hypothetical protein